MTAQGRSIDDRELDLLLRAMLAEGTVSAPERIAQQALAQVATTPQRRPVAVRSLRVRPMHSSPKVRLWFVAAAALVAVSIAAALAGFGRDPRPAPTPSPTPPEFVTFRSEVDGYELLIPGTWEEGSLAYDDLRYWSGPDGELSISYGTSIFEGGAVTLCAPPASSYATCQSLDFGYSVPFDPDVDGVGPIDLEVNLDRCNDGCPPQMTLTTLDGGQAWRSSLEISGRQTTYISGFHDRRPVILYWSEAAGASRPDRIDTMLASFRFLDPVVASPTPFVDPTELVLYRNLDDGYELLVPRFWGEGRTTTFPGVHRFGFGGGSGTAGDPALTISIGQPDGSVVVCQNMDGCKPLRASTLDELGEALISVPAQFNGALGVPTPRTSPLLLNGEDGEMERPAFTGSTHGCLGCPGMLLFEYILHDGRPIILAWDFWTIEFDRLAPAYVQQIVDSFRLLD